MLMAACRSTFQCTPRWRSEYLLMSLARLMALPLRIDDALMQYVSACHGASGRMIRRAEVPDYFACLRRWAWVTITISFSLLLLAQIRGFRRFSIAATILFPECPVPLSPGHLRADECGVG